MKCRSLFSWKNKRKGINSSSAVAAQRVVKVKGVLFSPKFTHVSYLFCFVSDFLGSTMGLFDLTTENSTLASRPWKDGRTYWSSFEFYPEWRGSRFDIFRVS